MRPLNYDEIKSVISSSQQHDLKISILLDRPQSDMNIGHIFRLADAAGLKHIYILNPAFHLNWQKIEKLSRKNSRHIPYTLLDTIDKALSLKTLIGLEWTDESHSTFKYELQDRKDITLVVGNEQKGIQPSLLDLCELSLHIPMYGLHSSMNMAMATSIVVYQLISKSL